MNPKISIIIPVYNVEKYLRECLDSVVNQTFRDLEIICVDDGSTDSSGQILEEYASRDNRMIVIHQENQGQSAARNSGILTANAKYLIFLDSDDFWSLDTCEKLYAKAEASGAQIIQFLYDSFGENAFPYVPEFLEYRDLTTESEKIAMRHTILSPWCYLFRTEFVKANELTFILNLLFEDIPFVIEARLLANKIVFVPEVLYHYRLGSGYSTNFQKEKSYFRLPETFNFAVERLRFRNASEESLRLLFLRKMNEVFFAWQVKKTIRRPFKRKIAERLLPEELELLRESDALRAKTRLFYLSITGCIFRKMWYSLKFRLQCAWDWFVERLYYRSSLYAEHQEQIAWLQTVLQDRDGFYRSMKEKNYE